MVNCAQWPRVEMCKSTRDNYTTTRFDKFRLIPKVIPLAQDRTNLDHRMLFLNSRP